MEQPYAAQIAEQEGKKNLENQIDEILSSCHGRQDELIAILQKIQQIFGYLPKPSMQRVARFFGLPESTIFGIATFYTQFKLVPTGKNVVKVCRGTACHVRGGQRILKEAKKMLGIRPGESTQDLEYCLETVACIGACALAPTMVMNQTTYGQVTPKKVAEILKDQEKGE